MTSTTFIYWCGWVGTQAVSGDPAGHFRSFAAWLAEIVARLGERCWSQAQGLRGIGEETGDEVDPGSSLYEDRKVE